MSSPSAPITLPAETTGTETLPVTADGDHERFSHIVRKDDQMKGYVLGESVVALCGKVWVPSRDPDKYPVCPTCLEVLAVLRASGGSGGGEGGKGSGGGDRR
jgi:hypothetical protein